MPHVRNNDRILDKIASKLSRSSNLSAIAEEPVSRTRAAVAMIVNPAAEDIEVLFIQRARHPDDPWSGHIAFPGGKLEDGEFACQAAQRETFEETGIDLQEAVYLGQFPDIVGANLPVRVSCCLFAINRQDINPVLNDEVSDLFWVGLPVLRDRKRHIETKVTFDDRSMVVPAICLPDDDRPVLWGITYRLVMEFFAVLEMPDSGTTLCEPAPYEISI
ncbi:MAG: CoA pyrophosphatase [Desulfuromonadales bacterium]